MRSHEGIHQKRRMDDDELKAGESYPASIHELYCNGRNSLSNDTEMTFCFGRKVVVYRQQHLVSLQLGGKCPISKDLEN